MNIPEPEEVAPEREPDLPIFRDLIGLWADTWPKDLDPVDYIRALRNEDEQRLA